TFYLVGTSRAKIREYEKQWLELPWQKVRGSVEVKIFARHGELYVLAKSEGRQAKEMAIRRKKLARLLRKLRAMRRSCPKRDQLLMRVGAAKTDAGRAFGFVKINRPQADQEVTVTLRHRLRVHAPGLTPRAVLEKLAGIQMLDVTFPTTDGRRLVLPRYTEPSPEQALLLHHLNLVLPPQPPPRITLPASSAACPQLKM